MGVSALATACVLVLASTRYDVSVRTEARVRSSSASEAASGPVILDVDLAPLLQLFLREGATGLQLSYSPRVSLRNLTSSVHPELQHNGRFQGEWRPFRGLQLFAIEGLSYGQVDAVQLSTTGSPTTTPSVRYLASESGVGFQAGFGIPRLLVTASASWLVSGGLGETAIPSQQGPRVSLAGGYRVDPRTNLTLTLLGTDAHFSTGSRASVLQGNPGLRYRLDPRTEAELSLGLGYTRNEDVGGTTAPDAGPRSVLLPSASGLFTRRLLSAHGQSLDGRVAVRLVPFVDPFTARAYHRAETSLAVSWLAMTQLRFNADVNGAFALSGGPQQGDAGLSSVLTGQWLINRRLWMEASFRGSWNRQQSLSSTFLFQWAASISLVAAQNGSF